MWLPPVHPLLGTWPAIQACALTGNRTGDPLVRRPVLNPLSHTSQGRSISLYPGWTHKPWQPQSLLFPNSSTWQVQVNTPPSVHAPVQQPPPSGHIVCEGGFGTSFDPWTFTSTGQIGLINPCTLEHSLSAPSPVQVRLHAAEKLRHRERDPGFLPSSS